MKRPLVTILSALLLFTCLLDKEYYLTIYLTKLSQTSKNQYPTIVLNHQKEIDNFSTLHTTSEILKANIVISGTDIVNLLGLSQVTKIEGFLYITNNKNLLDLSGLEELKHIENDFLITRNDCLLSLSGISQLSVINRNLIISENPKLWRIDGLSGLEMVGRDFTIADNNELSKIEGFGLLERVGGYFVVADNLGLREVCGLEGVDVGEGLTFVGCQGLGSP